MLIFTEILKLKVKTVDITFVEVFLENFYFIYYFHFVFYCRGL